jgi:glycogen synthase
MLEKGEHALVALRLFCAVGPGDAAADLLDWSSGKESDESIAKTYTSELFEFCKQERVELLAISSNSRRAATSVSGIRAVNISKGRPRSGIGFHLQSCLYGLRLLLLALRFRADVCIIDSGTTKWWVLPLFRLIGVQVIVKLHNAFWAKGHVPRKLAWFWCYCTITAPLNLCLHSLMAVSSECLLQAKLLRVRRKRMVSFLPQFSGIQLRASAVTGYISQNQQRPFHVLFLGRLEISKGTELLLEASQLCLAQGHSDILITFYGEGGNSAALRRFVEQRGLSDIVRLDGWKSSKHLIEALGKCDVVVMPTTSEFPEALGKSLIEAALLKVAVIATRVVPATGLLGSSCLVIPEDDARNLADAILLLKSDPLLLNRLQVGSEAERSVFFNPQRGLGAALAKVLTNRPDGL